MTMRDGDGKIIQKPFTEFDHPFLMARWAEMAALAGKGDQVFVTAVVTAHTGKTILQTTAIEVAKDRQPDLRFQISETGLIAFLVYSLQLLKKVLDTAVIVG